VSDDRQIVDLCAGGIDLPTILRRTEQFRERAQLLARLAGELRSLVRPRCARRNDIDDGRSMAVSGTALATGRGSSSWNISQRVAFRPCAKVVANNTISGQI